MSKCSAQPTPIMNESSGIQSLLRVESARQMSTNISMKQKTAVS